MIYIIFIYFFIYSRVDVERYLRHILPFVDSRSLARVPSREDL